MRAFPYFVLLASCASSPATAPPSTQTQAQTQTTTRALEAKPIALPFATAPAAMDYIATDPARRTVWAPVASARGGSVAIIDTTTLAVAHVDGFKTAEREGHGRKRTFGPSAVAVGDRFAYVGDRASNEICPVVLATRTLAPCIHLTVSLDGVAWVDSAKEVWLTSPEEKALTVLDSNLAQKTSIVVPGSPEGYAVDEASGTFFTNLEDVGDTVSVDVRTHAVIAKWPSTCGGDGPRGLAVDPAHVIVACTNGLRVLDRKQDGKLLASLDTGTGVDNIDYAQEKKLVYVAASKAGRLTVVRVADDGKLTVVNTGAIPLGARNAVVDATGTAFVTDAAAAQIVAVR